MKRIIFIAVCVLLGGVILINSVGCSVYDPYRHGKVVDANTKEPLEGVVVKGEWRIDYFPLYLTMGPSFDYATKETVTDENGNFSLGLGPWLYPGLLRTPSIHLYKEGYEDNNLTGISMSKRKVTHYNVKDGKLESYVVETEWENGRRIIPLRKSDVEE